MSPTKYHKAIAYILSNQYTNKRNLDLWQLIALEEDFVNLLSHMDNDFDEKKFSSLIRRYKPKDFVNHLEQKILSTDKQKDFVSYKTNHLKECRDEILSISRLTKNELSAQLIEDGASKLQYSINKR